MKWLTLIWILLSGAGMANETKHVAEILDRLHKSAADADGETYFSLFDEDGVFIGTDAKETWTIKEFRAYAEPFFKKGRGWVYTPKKRHIYFSPAKTVAWFDEILDSKSFGVSRRTGVLVKKSQIWKIAQYHLTIPIPNELVKPVTDQIKNLSR
ncbi:MAG: nuclear transport factor 2 family protein [Pseudobacteriovorax sp.]|nr:nuclear transport factor 2 family protein [Pseudobacteriovorax sp.]